MQHLVAFSVSYFICPTSVLQSLTVTTRAFVHFTSFFFAGVVHKLTIDEPHLPEKKAGLDVYRTVHALDDISINKRKKFKFPPQLLVKKKQA